nr:MAG TPA: hypothetical protein [Caudoviricetes sp.]
MVVVSTTCLVLAIFLSQGSLKAAFFVFRLPQTVKAA